jgi:hypothetical protein
MTLHSTARAGARQRAFRLRLCTAATLLACLGFGLGMPAAAAGTTKDKPRPSARASIDPNEPMIDYRAKAGDTIWGIAHAEFDDPKRHVRALGDLNKLKDHDRIQPGQRLQLPVRLLKTQKTELSLASVHGDVQVDGKPARVGQAVAEGARLTTAAGATATLARADGSKSFVLPGSQIEVQQNRALARQPTLLRTVLRMGTGAVENTVTPSSLKDHLVVRTVTSFIGVRGTQYRVGAGDAANKPSTRVEVLEGLVQAGSSAPSGAAVEVSGGFGSRIVEGEPPLPPVKLLDAPTLPAEGTTLQRRGAPIQLGRVEGAAEYNLRISPQAAPEVIVAELRGREPSLTLPADLPDGAYTLRARAIDALGLQGLERASRIALAVPDRPFNLSHHAPGGQGAADGQQGILLRWVYEGRDRPTFRVQIADNAAFDRPLLDDQVGSPAAIADHLPAGEYFWRVGVPGVGGDAWRFSAVERIRITR